MNRRRTELVLRLWLAAQLAASIAANELGADDSFEARIIAPVAPLVLFGTIESMLWIPGRRDALGVIRSAVTVSIGVGAAVLSFDTIGRLGQRAGLEPFEQAILALIIDGGILAVGLALVQLRQSTVDRSPPDAEPEPTTVMHTRNGRTPERQTLDKPSPSVTDRNLPTSERRQRVSTAAAVGDVDVEQLAERFGVSTRTIQRDLDAREQVTS